jgi:hypothetical protein
MRIILLAFIFTFTFYAYANAEWMLLIDKVLGFSPASVYINTKKYVYAKDYVSAWVRLDDELPHKYYINCKSQLFSVDKPDNWEAIESKSLPSFLVTYVCGNPSALVIAATANWKRYAVNDEFSSYYDTRSIVKNKIYITIWIKDDYRPMKINIKCNEHKYEFDRPVTWKDIIPNTPLDNLEDIVCKK